METTMPPAVIVPLRKSVRISDGESVRTLRPGQLHVAEGGQSLQAVGTTGALWIAIVAPRIAVAAAVRCECRAFDSRSCACCRRRTSRIEPSVARPCVPRAKRARAMSGKSDQTTAIARFATLLAELQSAFDPLIRRCPGRTLAQRRSVFRATAARLQPDRIELRSRSRRQRIRARRELFDLPLRAHVQRGLSA